MLKDIINEVEFLEKQLLASAKALADVADYVAAGDLARETDGVRRVLEMLRAREASSSAPHVDDELRDTVREMLKVGRYVPAVKHVRETTGKGLKESKDWVDENFPVEKEEAIRMKVSR